MDRCIDLIFFIDIILQFFLMYPAKVQVKKGEDPQKQAARFKNADGIEWVTSRSRIAAHYLTGWFAIDTLSVLASGTDIFALYQTKPCTTEEDDGSALDNLNLFRTLRVLRLIKLVRLVRASRVVKRLLSRMEIDYGTMMIVRTIIMIFVTGHWFACIIKMISSMADGNGLPTWLGVFGYCVPMPDLGNVTYLPCRSKMEDPCMSIQVEGSEEVYGYPYKWTEPGICCVPVQSIYLGAFAWSLMVITGTGGTDLLGLGPNMGGINTGETVVVSALLMIGCFMWAEVISTFVDVATNASPVSIIFRQNMDQLNTYMATQMMPHELRSRAHRASKSYPPHVAPRTRVHLLRTSSRCPPTHNLRCVVVVGLREYFHEIHLVNIREEQERIVHQMSAALQREVVLRANRRWLDKMWFLRNFEQSLLVQLAMSMQNIVYAPAEVPSRTRTVLPTHATTPPPAAEPSPVKACASHRSRPRRCST